MCSRGDQGADLGICLYTMFTVGANRSIQRSPYTTRSLNTTILSQKEVKNMPCLADNYF